MTPRRVLILAACAALACAQQPTGQNFPSALAPNTFVSGLPLTGATFVPVRGYALASGTTDLYTAPAGKRVLLQSGGGYNPTSGTINWYFEIKSGGTYYHLTLSVGTALNALAVSTAIGIVLEPGETISVVTDAANLNLSVVAIQFDSSSPLRTVKLLGPATGNNTIYTVPATRSAFVSSISGPSVWSSSLLSFVSDSGGAGSLNLCSVPFGGAATCAANSGTQIGFSGTGPLARTSLSAAGITMAAGDFLVLNVGTGNAAQIAWINVLEF